MNELELIDDGDEFFERLWNMIDESKVCCWVLTYHMVDNYIANETLKKLEEAAKRGVNVVLFVDWLNYYADKDLVKRLEQAGGLVRSLNPMDPLQRFKHNLDILSRDVFERYHQKLFLIDENVIVGSANLDSDYASSKYGYSKFYDLNIIIKGKCVNESLTVFGNIAERYNYPLAVPVLKDTEDPSIEILVSEPNYLRFDIQERVLEMINKAQTRIILLHGYYVYIPKIIEALRKAIARGVKVEMITSKLRDQPVYKHFENSWLTKHLRDMGIEVYEYTPKVMHMKAYLCDDEITVGSFNNDKWSWGLNNELNLYITDPKLTQKLVPIIEQIKLKSQKVQNNPLPLWKKSLIRFWEVFLYLSEVVMDRRKYYKKHFVQAFFLDPNTTYEQKYQHHIAKNKHQERKTFRRLLADSYA